MRGQRGKVAFFFRRTGAFFVALALLLLFSCGLPTSDYLYPPVYFSSPSGNRVQLIHDTRNIDDVAELFKGYDIYYRVFDSQNDATNSSSYLSNYLTSSDIAQIESTEGYYVLVKYDKTNTYLDDTVPLIPVSDNTHISFDLHLNSDSRWTITATKADESQTTLYYISRNKGDTATAEFCSRSQYLKGDLDYAGDGILVGESVYIVFFAVAYGISSSLSELYSDPRVLGPIQYTPMGGS